MALSTSLWQFFCIIATTLYYYRHDFRDPLLAKVLIFKFFLLALCIHIISTTMYFWFICLFSPPVKSPHANLFLKFYVIKRVLSRLFKGFIRQKMDYSNSSDYLFIYLFIAGGGGWNFATWQQQKKDPLLLSPQHEEKQKNLMLP